MRRRYHGSGHCSYGPATTATSMLSKSGWSADSAFTRPANRTTSGLVWT